MSDIASCTGFFGADCSRTASGEGRVINQICGSMRALGPHLRLSLCVCSSLRFLPGPPTNKIKYLDDLFRATSGPQPILRAVPQ
jgi:hypothetical protein